MASKVEVKIEMKSKSDKVWDAIKESNDVLPKALPQYFKSIQVLEGDGKSAGSVRLVTFQAVPEITKPAKEKVEKVDDANKTLSYSVIEGDVLQHYKKFKASISVSPKGDNGSVVKWWCEFDKASDQVHNPDLMKGFAVKNFQGLDAYILANP